MNDFLYTRKTYGDTYATYFESGTIVPWKLLSVKDYIHYNHLIKSNIYPLVHIEDEIFVKCVLDKVLVNNIDSLKAGIVGAVVQNILEYSGPATPEQLDNLLEVKRQEISNVLHQIVSWICVGFPSYKPDDLYALDYSDLILRLALAEEKLIRSGIIKEPFSFFNTEEGAPKEKPKQRRATPTPPVPPSKPPVENQAHKFQQQQQEQTIIKKSDIIESSIGMDGHSKDPVEHHKLTENTAKFYPEYIEQMKKGQKVSIPSTEERKLAAEERAKKNEAIFKKQVSENKEFTKEELERLKVIREQERKRRSKQRNR